MISMFHLNLESDVIAADLKMSVMQQKVVDTTEK